MMTSQLSIIWRSYD